MDNKKPSWIDGHMHLNVLEDEVSYLQYGQQTQHEFFSFKMDETVPSAWDQYPTPQEPLNRYKFASIEFNMSMNQMNWTRSTYSLLDWLGDLGGLLDILLKIGEFVV